MIANHVRVNKLLSKAQPFFYTREVVHNTHSQVLEVVTQAIHNEDDVYVIFLHVCKAFDKVPEKRIKTCMVMASTVNYVVRSKTV